MKGKVSSGPLRGRNALDITPRLTVMIKKLEEIKMYIVDKKQDHWINSLIKRIKIKDLSSTFHR